VLASEQDTVLVGSALSTVLYALCSMLYALQLMPVSYELRSYEL
jgi:hypothetical protein